METASQNILSTVVVILLYVFAAVVAAQIFSKSKYKLFARIKRASSLIEVPLLKPMMSKLYFLSRRKQQRVKEKA